MLQVKIEVVATAVQSRGKKRKLLKPSNLHAVTSLRNCPLNRNPLLAKSLRRKQKTDDDVGRAQALQVDIKPGFN